MCIYSLGTTLQTQTLEGLQGAPWKSILTWKTLFSLQENPVLNAGILVVISLQIPVLPCAGLHCSQVLGIDDSYQASLPTLSK